MNNQFKYPTTYELKEILSRIANRSFLDDFAQIRGLFITHANQELLADELSKLFYDECDLELIRKEAYRENNSHTLSGFIIKSNKRNFNLKTRYEGIRANGRYGLGIKLNEVTTVSDEEPFDFKSSFEYVKAKPGRIEFLQNEINSFDFYFTDLGKGSWQIEVDSNKSTDTKELKSLFLKNLDMDGLTLESMDQDYLNSKATIEFFDKLAKEGLNDKDWGFLDIKHLTVKRGNDDEENDESNDIDDNDGENEESAPNIIELSKQELTGITQAILEGKNLREDPFVKDCETRGYRFTAMTYEFEHKKNPNIISIKAEFKGRPKVFEVGIPIVQEKTGFKLIRQLASLSSKENRSVRSMFWNNAKRIYNEMKSQTK